jgi:hypothetical protein
VVAVRVEFAEGDPGAPLACSCGPGVPFVPGMPDETLRLAAWVRQACDRQEVCVYDGSVSFAREPGGPRTRVRAVR